METKEEEDIEEGSAERLRRDLRRLGEKVADRVSARLWQILEGKAPTKPEEDDQGTV